MPTKEYISQIYRSLPRTLSEPIDCIRRRPVWREKGVIFFHVPKAAGTSVSLALYDRSLGHFKASRVQKYCPNEFKNLLTFSLTRNPWDRVVSAYHFAKQGGTNVAGVFRSEQYNTPAFRSFDTFVNEWLVNKDITQADFIFQPQYLFTELENGKLNHIGKVEKMHETEIFLSKALDRNISFSMINQSNRAQSYKKFYQSKSTKDTISNLYARDINTFSYEF